MAYGTGDAEERQIKRLYAVMHSLGIDPKQWKKDHNIASYAKMTWEERSKYITELEELEKEKKGEVPAGGATIKDDAEAVKEEIQSQVGENEQLLDEAHAQAEVARMAVVMKFCATEAQQIVEGMSNGGVTEGTKAGMIQKFATAMFIEAMRRGL
jgi:hypothetical protein